MSGLFRGRLYTRLCGLVGISVMCDGEVVVGAVRCPFCFHFARAFEKEKVQWAGPELNRRPQPRKGCVLTRLDDRPFKI